MEPPRRKRRGPVLRARRAGGPFAAGGRRRARAAVPNFFTLMNLLAGFFSLIQTATGNLEAAAWLVVLAGFFDLLDGMMARLVGVSGEFGVELDSLSDVVSFGVAPSFLLYVFGLHQLGPLWGALLASLPALFGAVRLARFNSLAVAGEKQAEFSGLPIPAQAGAVVVFILVFADRPWFDVLARPQLSALVIDRRRALGAHGPRRSRSRRSPSPTGRTSGGTGSGSSCSSSSWSWGSCSRRRASSSAPWSTSGGGSAGPSSGPSAWRRRIRTRRVRRWGTP